MKYDPVTKPRHYLQHPSGIEPIILCEKMNFNVGNAFKYLYRCDLKGNTLQDLSKAKWYIDRELERRRELLIKWENDKFRARFDGSDHIQQVLNWESRFCGWMCQALDCLYTASVQKRGVNALEAAARCVGNMIKIHESKITPSPIPTSNCLGGDFLCGVCDTWHKVGFCEKVKP